MVVSKARQKLFISYAAALQSTAQPGGYCAGTLGTAPSGLLHMARVLPLPSPEGNEAGPWATCSCRCLASAPHVACGRNLRLSTDFRACSAVISAGETFGFLRPSVRARQLSLLIDIM